jgi:hypothetical protein
LQDPANGLTAMRLLDQWSAHKNVKETRQKGLIDR